MSPALHEHSSLETIPRPSEVHDYSVMAFKFLSAHSSAGGTSSSVKLFDIRLDNDYIVFRGSEDEAGSARLSGELALCLTDVMTITGITLTLSGIVHMS